MSSPEYRRGYDRIIWKPLPPIVKPKKTPPARGAFSCPMVIGDGMDPTEHIDGKLYDSKSAFRAVTKANGCIEVGNEKIERTKPARKGPSVRESLMRARAKIS